MHYGFIYITTNLVTGERYVGKRVLKGTDKDKTYLGSGTIIKLAIKKYGLDKFERDVLLYCDNDDQLEFEETRLIREFGTIYPNGYNLIEKSGGGDLLKHHPRKKEIYAKQSEVRRGMKFSDERNRKVSEALTGIKRSEETKLRNSEAQKNPIVNDKKVKSRRENGKPWHTKESRERISNSNKGKIRSPELREHQGNMLRGRSRPEHEILRMKRFMTSIENRIPCEYCGYLLNKNNYNQHSNKCQSKPK